jgi:TonB-linked SusC/RagA family outer membrane protein
MKKQVHVLGIMVLLLLFVFKLEAQKTIKGRTLNEVEQAPLPGVIILEKGTNNNTLSNLNGEYTLIVANSESIIVYSYVGMESVEMKANRELIDVNLKLKGALKELVVTALGVSREKKSLGYAVSEVSGADLVRSGESNVIQGLAGKAAGIQVISSGGTPGASSKITIRGNQTFTGNNQPLIVVDGVPIDNTTFTSAAADNPYNTNLDGVNNSNRAFDINPNDIETVTVLKGPAAAALYGQRAGTGAIIYTTKKGKYKKGLGVTFSSNIEVQRINKLPERQKNFAQGTPGDNGPEYFTADPGPDQLFDTADDISYGTSQSWGPSYSNLGDSVRYHDIYKDAFKTGIIANNQLAITGGSESTMYRFSISNLKNDGVIPNTSTNRTTVRLNAEHKLTDKIKVGTSISYSATNSVMAQNGSNLAGIMLGVLRAPSSFDLTPYSYEGTGYTRTYFGLYDNPLYTAHKNPFTSNVNRVFGNTYLSADPCSWLNITYKIGIDAYNDQRRQVYSVSSAGDDNSARYGQVNYDNVNNFQLYSDLLINLKKDFGTDFHSRLTLGNNVWNTKQTSQFSRGRNLVLPGFYNLSNANELYSSNSLEQIRTFAAFFNGELDWRNAIYLTLTGRNEWASTFSQGKNNFFYPSASVSVVVSELAKLPSWFEFLKVRGNVAQSGIAPQPYKNRTYYTQPFFADGFTIGNSFPYLGQTGYGVGNIKGFNGLKPERVIGYEAGTEMRFFKGRLSAELTYYYQKTIDILLDKPVAPSSGFASQYVNSGQMQNKGWELAIGGTPISTSNFKWDISATWYRNRSKVLELADGVTELDIETAFSDVASFAIVGQPYGSFYGTAWQRNGDGKLIIDPATGLPVIDPKRKNLGNPYPDWLSGIRNTFTIANNFSISFLLDIRKGGKIWNGTYGRMNAVGTSKDSEDRDRTYVIEGVVSSGTDANGLEIASNTANSKEITAYSYFRNYRGDTQGATEEFIQNGGWVRLRELSMNYRLNFKPNKKGKTPIQYIDFNLTGINVFLITKYKGVDPETSLTGAGSNIQGYDYFNNPGVRSYSFGISAGF